MGKLRLGGWLFRLRLFLVCLVLLEALPTAVPLTVLSGIKAPKHPPLPIPFISSPCVLIGPPASQLLTVAEEIHLPVLQLMLRRQLPPAHNTCHSVP